jgi:hypothetical protein
MGIEYIAEDDYKAFKILVTTTLPRDFEMWLRVRERGKLISEPSGNARRSSPRLNSRRKNLELIARD